MLRNIFSSTHFLDDDIFISKAGIAEGLSFIFLGILIFIYPKILVAVISGFFIFIGISCLLGNFFLRRFFF